MILATGCETGKNLTTPTSEPKIDETLPVLDVKNIKLFPDIKTMSIEWVGNSGETVNGYHIYRKEMGKENSKFTRVGTLADKYARHYVDSDLTPNTKYAYCLSTIGKDGAESYPSDAKAVQTYPIFDSVAFVRATSDLPRKVRIEWRPHELLSIKEYLLERRTQSQNEWKSVAPIKNRLNVEFIDTNLKDETTYSYRLKSISFDGIESNPSEIVSATTKKLPIAVGSLDSSKDQPQQIALQWTPSAQEDVVGYNIYVSSEADRGFKFLARAQKGDSGFVHKIEQNDKINFYKVASLDKDGLETDIKLLAPVMGKTLSAPLQPTVTLAQITQTGAILNWVAGDSRAVSYTIIKRTKEGFLKYSEKVNKGITALRYEDVEVLPGVEYAYQIEAVDIHGLVSKKTDSTTLFIPNLEEKKTQKKQAVELDVGTNK